MATLTAANAASTAAVKGHGMAGNVKCAWGTYTLAANPTAADILQFCRVPAGARIVGGNLYGADIDTGTEELDLDIGWAANGGSGTYDAADPDGLGNFGVITGDAFAAGNISNVTGINYPLAGLLVTGVLPYFTRETIIQGVFNVDAATGGTGILTLVVYYVIEG